MHLAAKHLVSGSDVAAVARRVGYRSPATFSRTFKSWVGQSPATYRRSAGAAASPELSG